MLIDLAAIERTTVTTYNMLAERVYKEGGTTSNISHEAEVFLQSLEGNLRVLDIGCGIGEHTPWFIGSGCEYVGIDASANMLAFAQQDYPKACFQQMSFRKLEFPAESFDGFWAVFALQHEAKSNMVSNLREIRRVMKPSGIGFIQLPLGDEERMNASPYDDDLLTYVSYWQEEEFVEKLEESGMKVDNSYAAEYCLTFFVSMKQ